MLAIVARVRFSDLTTLRLGGPIRELVTAKTKQEIVDAVREADAQGMRLMVLGGGSNLVVSDEGFDGRVVKIATGGVAIDSFGTVKAAAGRNWDELVVATVEAELQGFETLSGIPGSTGATPVQNVGAYGAEMSQTVESVEVFDRETNEMIEFDNEQCKFVYRSSIFKRNPRYVILEVTFALRPSAQSVPITYAELARTLGVEIGGTAPLQQVREAVLGLRRGKGMVLDAGDIDTFSVGSFFTNPIVSKDMFEKLPEAAPHWPADDMVKVSAAWLIGQAGFNRGHRHGRVGISTKHTLALVNADQGTTAELVDLAHKIQASVKAMFDIDLHPEPVAVGVSI